MRTTSPRTESVVAGGRGADRLVADVERRGAVARLERAVHGEVHRGVVDDAVDAAVDAAERVAGELGRHPRRLGPALAVRLERRARASPSRGIPPSPSERCMSRGTARRLPIGRRYPRASRRQQRSERPPERVSRSAASDAMKEEPPMPDAVIVDAVRTPLGRRNGKLKDGHPVDLAAHTLAGARRAQRPRSRARRRRDHGLRHAGRRPGRQRRPQRRARRRLPRDRRRHDASTASAARRSRPRTSPRRA